MKFYLSIELEFEAPTVEAAEALQAKVLREAVAATGADPVESTSLLEIAER